MRRQNILLFIPYFSNRSGRGVYHAIGEDPNVTTFLLNAEIERDRDDYYFLGDRTFTVGEGEDRGTKLKDIVDREAIDLVVPTKDALVRLCSDLRCDMPGKLFLPCAEVITILQDKLRTYELFGDSDVLTPVYYRANAESLRTIESMLEAWGSVVEKPRTGSSGQDVRQITELAELDLSDEHIVCEPLAMPEFNQSFVVRDGVIHGGITYRSARKEYSPTSNVARVMDLPEGRVAMQFLMTQFRPEEVSGAYNLDFMLRDDGRAVLNEVNPGRFPAGAYPLRDEFKELIRTSIYAKLEVRTV